MPDDQTLLAYTEQAIKGGMTLLQYRNKSPPTPEEARRQASQLLKLCNKYNIPLLINDDVQLAFEIGAHGVHIGQDDMTLVNARQLLGPEAIIGVTCKDSVDAACIAESNGASYIAFGRFFPSHTKPVATYASLSVLIEAKEHCSLPVVAIGGITVDNCKPVIEAGANMLAVVHALFSAPDITHRAQTFVQRFAECHTACKPVLVNQ